MRAVQDRYWCKIGVYNVPLDTVMKKVKMGMGRGGEISGRKERVEITWLLVCI